MRLDAKDLAHGVQPPVLLHPLLVVCDEQPPIVDPTRVNPSLLEFRHSSFVICKQDFENTHLLKPCDNLPGVGQKLNLGVVGSEAPEKTSRVPCCACDPAQQHFLFDLSVLQYFTMESLQRTERLQEMSTL